MCLDDPFFIIRQQVLASKVHPVSLQTC